MSTQKKKIKKELLNKKALQECAARFDVVGDPTRLKICWLLCKHSEMSVGEIAKYLDMEPSAISHALRKLREAGVVSDRREVKFKFYSLNDSSLSSFIKLTIS